MPLPAPVRRLAPGRLRHSVRLRSWALAAGLIPPRPMHSTDEARLLAELAAGARVAVEIGVYEGSSAVVLCRALPADADLHLVDPFTAHATLLPGWRGVEGATRRAVGRAVRERRGPRLHWHVELSERTAERWSGPVDLVFVDGDHSVEGCRLDWDVWSPHVTRGGTVVFHDARAGHPEGEGLPGPTRVVDELFRGDGTVPGWRIHAEVDSAVAVRRER
jgi:MMP 1-O-methyltransferase